MAHEDRTAGVHRSDDGRVLVVAHDLVVQVASDPDTYSSAVSTHIHVPNGLDGAAHLAARRLLDPFFAPEALAPLRDRIDAIARDVVAAVVGGAEFDAVADLGARFAVRGQCAWLGWPSELEDELLDWVAANRAATRSRDRSRTAQVAADFDGIIRRILAEHTATRDAREPDVTDRLIAVRDERGAPLTPEAVVSVLRNWTGGDLSSLALCAGVIAHSLVAMPALQERIRLGTDAEVDAIIDELLRRDDPFPASRRVVRADAEIGGCPVYSGDRVVLDWISANRDPAVFPDPDALDPRANAAQNLVYGAGPHICPGRPLATMELRALTRAVVAAGTLRVGQRPAVRETAPAGGFAHVPVTLAP